MEELECAVSERYLREGPCTPTAERGGEGVVNEDENIYFIQSAQTLL